MPTRAPNTTHTCQIMWIDKHGNSTPDDNPAIGRVMVREHTVKLDMVDDPHDPRIGVINPEVTIPASRWYYICAQHARQLTDPGMENWVFESFTEGQAS